jgi:hypothetical protein
VAFFSTRVREGAAGLGDELPVITGWMQRKLEDPECIVIQYFTVRRDGLDFGQVGSPVPTINSRMPPSVSSVPLGVWGANRS